MGTSRWASRLVGKWSGAKNGRVEKWLVEKWSGAKNLWTMVVQTVNFKISEKYLF